MTGKRKKQVYDFWGTEGGKISNFVMAALAHLLAPLFGADHEFSPATPAPPPPPPVR
jgi:hypothetical protein